MGGRSIAQVPFQVHHVKNTTGCPRKSTFLRFRVLDQNGSKIVLGILNSPFGPNVP